MGDAPPPSSSPNNHLAHEAFKPGMHETGASESPASFAPGSHPGSSAFQQQFQPSPFDPTQNAFTAQFDMTQVQGSGRSAPQGPYNMSAMAHALPQPAFRPGTNHGAQVRYNTDSPSSGLAPQMAQYAGQTNMNHLAGQSYYMAQPAHVSSYYSAQLPPAQQQANMPQRHNMNYYPNQIMMNHAQQSLSNGYYYPPPTHYPGHSSAMASNMIMNQYMGHEHHSHQPGNFQDHSGANAYTQAQGNISGRSSSNVVRGPPRKPRQSGHAIWIGNLPPQTDLMSLVHHVCNEATGLESLFLISKSNCAFANFKDEPSCIRAQQKLHDSKFQSVRLVSRLRKSTVEGASGQTAPTGPSATSPGSQIIPPEPSTTSQQTPTTATVVEPVNSQDQEQETRSLASTGGDLQRKDKFFVLKSLTVEDLDLSIRNGVWATQSHNEESLNSAFKEADNVYLVFSANKSGEYFGYARMVSPINNDPAAAIEFAPKAQATNDLDLPKAIPTEATENCPRGNIIDDSARGTIFWEIEREDGEPLPLETDSEDSASARGGIDGELGPKAWGKPFKLEWLSTTRLPFYRTRGLRNPWNSNREVKIARDGTELEPSVGRRLIGLFNRVQSPAPPMSMGIRQGIPVVAGYPPPPMVASYAPQ